MSNLPVSVFDFTDFSMNWFSCVCHNEARANGWHNEADGDPAEPKRIAVMLLNAISELVEAHEEIRNNKSPTVIYAGENDKPEGLAVEIADAFIRLGDMAAALKLDLDTAIAAKLNYNRTRGYRHGGKAA